MEFFRKANAKTLRDFRNNFYEKFLDKREECIENSINKIYKEKKMDKDMIQTRLNDKVLIFKKAIHEIEKRDKHQIIMNTAKDKKSTKLIMGLEIDN